jgi:TonB-linked SusC/RagA family outer membrane protein
LVQKNVRKDTFYIYQTCNRMKKLSLVFGMMLFVLGTTLAQRTISGTVTDADGEALIGASILAQGTTSGTVTDIDGSYTLNVPEGVTTLVFSYTGFRSREVALGTSNVIDVTLEEAVEQLNEVVVVGYGTQIKSTVTGNIAKVGSEQLENTPVTSLEQNLQGKSAGVFIESVNGKPGAQMRVRIRGSASITASNQPLYVIDGIPVTTASQNVSGAPLNPLADLNFNDIESVEILKDASAAAIYGSRAANGVILITTKQGKKGKTKIEAGYQFGFSNPTGRREFLNAEEYVELFTEAAVNLDEIEGNTPDGFNWKDWVEARFDRYAGPSDWRAQQTDTDWQDEAFRDNALSRQANLNFSGGDEKTRFYVGLGWSDQEGILVGNGFNRLSGRLNLDHNVNEKLTVGLNMSLSRTFTDQVSNDNAFSTPLQLVAQAPISPPRNILNTPFTGDFGGRTFQPGELLDRPYTTYYNGLIDTEEAQREITTYRNIANGYVRYELAPGLRINAEAAIDLYNVRDDAFWGVKTFTGQANNGTGSSNTSQILNVNTKAYANYITTLNDVHNLDLVAGIEYQRSQRDFTGVDGNEFPVDDLKTIASAADITFGTSTFTEFSFASYFLRANYNFDRKYLLSVSARVDGSSRFGENNRYGVFPAVSAGWVLSEEDFLAGSSTISFLKLRASWGQTGNAAIGNFPSLGLFGAEGYNGTPGLQPTQIPNPDLTWENVTQIDIGIDFGFVDNRINGEIDYYLKETDDLLLNVPVPSTAGFTSQTQNVGAIKNSGVEFVLNTNNLVGDFKWSTSLNLAFNQNEVTRLAEGQEMIDDGLNIVKVGEPIGVFFGKEYAGVDPTNGDAIWFVNGEGTGDETTNVFSEANDVVIGNPNPDVIGGVTNDFSYKGFSLSVSFRGTFGQQLFNTAGNFMSAQGAWFDNQTKDQLNRWTPTNTDTDVPKAIFLGGNGDQRRQSRYISEGSFVRLQNVTFGYEFPRSVLQSIGLSRLRLYVTGQNLATFTDYDGWDPEVSSDAFVGNISFGQDFYAAPQPKTVVFGINIGL